MFNAFDRDFSAATLQAFSGSPSFDWVIRLLVDMDLLRLGPLIGVLVYVWVAPRGRIEDRPEFVLRSFAGIVLATMASRLLQASLPERPRPRHALETLAFPSLGHLQALEDWSSFPSDTATFVFAVVAAIAVRSRPLACLAAAWATAFVCFPRLYLGYHYLSDLVAGAVLGVVLMGFTQWLPLSPRITCQVHRLAERHPALGVALLVLVGYELITTFRALRQTRDALRDILHVLAA